MSGAALHHLNLRVAWHDNRWNGHICRAPSKIHIALISTASAPTRDDSEEDKLSDKPFWELKEGQFPPCQAELRRVHEREDVVANVPASLQGNHQGPADPRQADQDVR